MKTPYIGITDFMSATEAERMLKFFGECGAVEAGRRLMVGVMMSYKTLNGIPTKWTAAFPAKETIKDIFISHPLAFNTLHYADYEGFDVARSIERAASFGGPNMHAIQLDMIWPDPRFILDFRERHPWIQIIIQGNSNAMDVVDNNPIKFVNRLHEYSDTIDYVLLDKSMGKGLGMNAYALLPFARVISKCIPSLGIAVAGGLGPDTLNLLDPLLPEFPNLSIDAQGKLRPSGSALDPIDWRMAELYLQRALQKF